MEEAVVEQEIKIYFTDRFRITAVKSSSARGVASLTLSNLCRDCGVQAVKFL